MAVLVSVIQSLLCECNIGGNSKRAKIGFKVNRVVNGNNSELHFTFTFTLMTFFISSHLPLTITMFFQIKSYLQFLWHSKKCMRYILRLCLVY
jgi:hypothetical protein